jgi:hypothetical protein
MDERSNATDWRPPLSRCAGQADTASCAAPGSLKNYSPYSVDWRFLPEEMLLLKDYFRHHVVQLNNLLATSRSFSPLWTATIGQRTLNSILAAKVLFIHIPKTGGTSICKVLYGRNLPHFTAEFHYNAFSTFIAGIPSFSVMRHPVQRLVSCYRFTVAGGTDIMASSRFERLRLRGLESFETFVDFLFEARGRLSRLPNTFHDQSAFVLGRDGQVLTTRLYCLDEKGQPPAELVRSLGVASIPRLNATKPTPVTISSETEAKIRQLYARDFEIYDRLAASGGFADMKGCVFGGP